MDGDYIFIEKSQYTESNGLSVRIYIMGIIILARLIKNHSMGILARLIMDSSMGILVRLIIDHSMGIPARLIMDSSMGILAN